MSENENKREKTAKIHAGGIVREIESRFCIALLSDAKINLNDKNVHFRAQCQGPIYPACK